MTDLQDKTALVPAVLDEIEAMHRFFTQWFGGTIPRTEANFDRFRTALDPSFAQVNPQGLLRPYRQILHDVWAHWNWFPGDPDFRIWIAEAQVCHLLPGDHALAVYQEWHNYQGKNVGRTCTGLVCRRAGTPAGIAWLQMHESLIPG